MGDISDYYRGHQNEYDWWDVGYDGPDNDHFNDEHYKHIWTNYQKKKLKWQTKEGKPILIQDMNESHMNNILKNLCKHSRKSENRALSEWIDVFTHEISIRPPQALPDFS